MKAVVFREPQRERFAYCNQPDFHVRNDGSREVVCLDVQMGRLSSGIVGQPYERRCDFLDIELALYPQSPTAPQCMPALPVQ